MPEVTARTDEIEHVIVPSPLTRKGNKAKKNSLIFAQKGQLLTRETQRV
jgi:hypothetical protein